MASASSGSSWSSSSRNYPPSYRQAQTSPLDPTWTPVSRSTVSALTSVSSGPQTPLGPLDLGPPGYQATITLFERTADETTVYLGPWAIETPGVDYRCLSWQCSYQGETLEDFLPSSSPADIVPISLHAHHRRFEDPREMELYLTFREPHRVRYTTADGAIVHDAIIDVKYVFATFEGSIRFQGDLRNRDLVDFFDIDVVWSDRDGRTDAFGAIRGLATGQRMKLWKDRYASSHSFSFLGRDRHFREYPVGAFERDTRSRDDRHRRLRLVVHTRRGSGQEGATRRVSLSSLRSRRPSADSQSGGSSSHASGSSSHHQHHHDGSLNHGLNIRYLGVQLSRPAGETPQACQPLTPSARAAKLPKAFHNPLSELWYRMSSNEQHGSCRHTDYSRFMEQWVISHEEDSAFNGIPFPLHHIELPSDDTYAGDSSELPSESYSGLQTVPDDEEYVQDS